MKTFKMVLFTLFLTATSIQTFAQRPAIVLSDKTGWRKIGETTVNFKSETDELMVVGANRFKAVKIKVTDAPVNLKSFDIYFNKGDKQSVTIGHEIKAAGESQVVDLDGAGERDIKKVIFTYNTAASSDGKKAHIELLGLKTNPGRKK